MGNSAGSRPAVYRLTHPLFALALALLLANDFWLKQAHPGWLSGKLSDVTGLFVLAWLLAGRLTGLFPAHGRRAVWGMLGALALAFAWWKSPLSGPFIASWNAWGPYPIARVVDMTDLAALAVLPLVPLVSLTALTTQPGRRRMRFSLPHLPRWTGPPLLALAVFAVMATSQATPPLPPEMKRVLDHQVRDYRFEDQELEALLPRLRRLVGDLPAEADLPAGSRYTGSRDRQADFMPMEWDIPGYTLYTWRYGKRIKLYNDYNIVEKRRCVELLARGAPMTDIPALIHAHIKYHQLKDGVDILYLELRLCDAPRRRTKAEALDYFAETVLPAVEAGLYR